MYQVEKIVKSRINSKGKKQYFIKWQGYDNSQNTWEPQKNLVNVKDLLEDYLRKQGSVPEKKILKTKQEKKTDEQQKSQLSNEDADADQGFNQEEQQQSQVDSINKSNGRFRKKTTRNYYAKPQKRKIIKIIGMNELENEGFVYKIESEGKSEWVRRGFFFPDYMLELIEYYESCLHLKKTY